MLTSSTIKGPVATARGSVTIELLLQPTFTSNYTLTNLSLLLRWGTTVVVSVEFLNLSCKMSSFCYDSLMDHSKIITIEPGKRSGKPTIRGTRMTVTDVLEYLAGGMTEEEILADFPDLTAEDIKACLAFAADRVEVY